MEFRIEQGVEVLRNTPGVLRTMLAGLSGPWVMSNYGENTFSPFDVVGHLIHGERKDWLERARTILEHGPGRAFEPFDRYAMYKESEGKSIDDLLDEFGRLRAENLKALHELRLRPDQLSLRGRHPALGEVTLGQLLATWVVHDLNHIAQIAKAMSFQYADATGPWKAYLSILKPPQPA